MNNKEEELEETETAENKNEKENESKDYNTPIHKFIYSEKEEIVFARELVTAVTVLFGIGLIAFLYTGVWPPFVAIESGSMEPEISRGDLIVVLDNERHGSSDGDAYGIVTAETGEEIDYTSKGNYGDVIIFESENGREIIHRAEIYVEEGENWFDRVDQEYVPEENCEQLINCPAPEDGFITKGDANNNYDQVTNRPLTGIVTEEQIVGIAGQRVPYLGYPRLFLR